LKSTDFLRDETLLVSPQLIPALLTIFGSSSIHYKNRRPITSAMRSCMAKSFLNLTGWLSAMPANICAGTDADQIIVATVEAADAGALPKISYASGSIENPDIRNAVCRILEGSQRAFLDREKR
jgi:hypothetical protein